MKNLLFLALAFVIALSLVACGSNSSISVTVSAAEENSEISPDGKLRIESVNMYEEPNEQHSLTELRIINVSTDEILWSGESFLDNKFIWSEDSRFVTVEYSGRQWTETDIIDTESFDIIKMPGVDDILKISPNCSQPNSNVPMPLFKAVGWDGSEVVLMSFEWTTNDDTIVSGEYEYNLEDKTITNIGLNEEYQRG